MVVHVDHIIPVVRGGSNDDSNLVTACADCNLGKGAVPLRIGRSFLLYLRAQRGRNDWVGDFADDEARTPLLSEPDRFRSLLAQVRERRLVIHDEVIHAAWDAWREWQRGGVKSKTVLAHEADLRRRILEPGSCVWLKQGWWANTTFHPYSVTSP